MGERGREGEGGDGEEVREYCERGKLGTEKEGRGEIVRRVKIGVICEKENQGEERGEEGKREGR